MANESRFGAVVAAILASSFLAAAAGDARADDVLAKKKGVTLVLKGDADGNGVLLLSAGGGTNVGTKVLVRPTGTSTLNGVVADAEFDNVVNVKASLGDGADSFHAEAISFDGSVKVAAGDGDDSVLFVDCNVEGNLLIAGSKGSLDCQFRTVSVDRTLVVRGGSGNDAVTCVDLDVGLNTVIALGSGTNGFGDTRGSYNRFFSYGGGPDFDTFSCDGTSIGQAARCSMGPGTNRLAMTDTRVGEDFQYLGGPGDDDVDLFGTLVGESASFSLSSGTNSLTIDLYDANGPDPGFQRSLIGENLTVKGGSGNDTISTDNSTGIGEKTRLTLASGNNTCNLLNTAFGDDLFVSAGSGDDVVDITGSDIQAGATYKLGGGTNTQP